MYKVFFQDRPVFLSESVPSIKAGPGRLITGLKNQSGLRRLLDDFSGNEQLREMYVFHPDMGVLMDAFKGCFKCLSAGGGLVLNRKGEFLVIERNGVWDLPKGKMEKGEDFEGTALREVEEETGLTGLEVMGLLLSTFHTYPLKSHRILKETRWYEMFWDGTRDPVLQADEGITDFRWVKSGESDFIVKNSYASILDVLRLKALL